jgi:hypothetical protein
LKGLPVHPWAQKSLNIVAVVVATAAAPAVAASGADLDGKQRTLKAEVEKDSIAGRQVSLTLLVNFLLRQ